MDHLIVLGVWLCWSAFSALVEGPGSTVVCGNS